MLARYLWAIAAGLAIGLVLILVSRWLDSPVVGWAVLVGLLLAAYLRARTRPRR